MINSESPTAMNGSVLYILPASFDSSVSNKGISKTRSLSDLEEVLKNPPENCNVDRRNSISGASTLSSTSPVEALVGPFKTLEEAQAAANLLKNRTAHSIPNTVDLQQNVTTSPNIIRPTRSTANSNGNELSAASNSQAIFFNRSKSLNSTKPLPLLTTKGNKKRQAGSPASPGASKMQANLSEAAMKLFSFLPTRGLADQVYSPVNPGATKRQANLSTAITSKLFSFLPTEGHGNQQVCSPENPFASKMQANLSIDATSNPQVSSAIETKLESFLLSGKENNPDDSTAKEEECKTEAVDSPVKKKTPKRKKKSVPPVTKVATLVFFDLETTGLAFEIGKSNVQITETSMIAISRKEFEESTFDDLRDIRIIQKICLCTRPRSKVSSSAAAVTGLGNENLVDQNPFERNAAEAINFFLSHLPKPVCLLAHNGNLYDFPLLKAEFSRLSMSLPSDILIADTLKAFRAFGVPVFPPDQKVCKSVKYTKKGQVSYSLSNLHLYLFNKNPTGSHSSEGDCIALAKVCHRMKDLMLLWIDENCKTFESVSPMW